MEFFLQYSTHFCTILLKNTKIKLKYGPKVVIENFIGTKSLRKILKGLKRKVVIFIGTKNIFNQKI